MKNLKSVQERLKQNINWIGIGLVSLAMFLFSLFSVSDGEVNVRPFPASAVGWILWTVNIFAPAFLSVVIVQAFRQEGVRIAHKDIPEVREARSEWLEATAKDKTSKFLSKEQYYRKELLHDGIVKFFAVSILSFAVVSVSLRGDLSNIIALVFQLILSIGFGLPKMFRAIDFCIDNLIPWYKKETERIKLEHTQSQQATIVQDLDCKDSQNNTSKAKIEAEVGVEAQSPHDIAKSME